MPYALALRQRYQLLGLRHGSSQRLLAHHMFARGHRLLGHFKVQSVRRAYVHGIDRLIAQDRAPIVSC